MTSPVRSQSHQLSAQILVTIPTLTVVSSKPFTYFFQSDRVPSEHLRVRLLNKPANAYVVRYEDGMLAFEWQPPDNLPPETVIIVQTYDARVPQSISTQRMVLRSGLVASPPNTRAPTVQQPPTVQPEPTQEQTPEQVLPEQLLPEKPASIQPSEKITRELPEALPEEPIEQPPEQAPEPTVKLNLHGPTLPELGAQSLTVEKEFQLYIRPTDADGDTVVLAAGGLPAGASLNPAFDGSWSLTWRPDVTQSGKHTIILSAVEVTASRKQMQQRLVLMVKDPNAIAQLMPDNSDSGQSVGVPDGEAKIIQTVPAGTGSPVYFEPLSAQIVSAGHTISLPVVSRTEDEAETILHIDRLPNRASFDVNPNGSRTFYWPTTPADQGEHIFRFTAVNPRDASQVASKDLLIVIGDPAAASSEPQ